MLACLCTGIWTKLVYDTFALEEVAEFGCVFLTKFIPDTNKGSYNLFIGSRANSNHSKFDLYGQLLILDSTGFKIFKKYREVALNSQGPIKSDIGGVANDMKRFNLTFDNKVTAHVTGEFGRQNSMEEYYFYLCDLSGQLQKYKVRDEEQILSRLLQYNLRVLDSEGSEMGANDKGVYWVVLLGMGMYWLLLFYAGRKIKSYYDGNQDVDYPLILLLMVSLFALMSITLRFFSEALLKAKGQQLVYLEAASEICQIISDSLLSVMFVLLMRGWGIRFSSVLEDFGKEVWCGGLIYSLRFFFHLVCLVAIPVEEQHFHSQDSVTVNGEIVLSLVFLVWFLYSSKKTGIDARRKHSSYFRLISLFGTAYFAVRPILIYLFTILWPIRCTYISPNFALLFDVALTAGLVAVLTNQNGVYLQYSLGASMELAQPRGDIKHS